MPALRRAQEEPVNADDVYRRFEVVLRQHLGDTIAFGPIAADAFADGVGEATVDGEVHRLVVSALGVTRASDIRGRRAQGVLRLAAMGAKPDAGWVVIGLPRVGLRILKGLRDFMKTHAPQVGWALVSEGASVLVWAGGQGEEVVAESAAKPARGQAAAPVRNASLFTDLNRWLVKWLLEARRQGRAIPRHPLALSKLANVSPPKAYRFSRTFHAAGFLRLDARGLELVRVRELLDAWLMEDRLQPARVTYVRDLFGREPDLLSHGARRAGFDAAREHGALHIAHTPLPMFHVRGAVDAVLDAAQLSIVDAKEASAAVLTSRYPESVFRRLPGDSETAVDLWQAALDVASHPVRGAEQAAFIRDRILSAWEVA